MVEGTYQQRNRLEAGHFLREARRARKLTVDEVAVQLRIPPVHLHSLEGGDFSIFSAEVYARGAYQKYARFLGVDSQKSYYAFLRLLSGGKKRPALSVLIPSKWYDRLFTPYGLLAGLIGLMALLVTGYLGWQVFTFVRLPDLELLEPQLATINEVEVAVRGRSEEGASVMVNGEAVLPGEGGVFEYMLPLHVGINVLQVEAVGAAGQRRVITKDILRS